VSTPFAIDGRAIGAGAPPYLVAEIGINHGGDADVAIGLVRAAKEAGADAAKLQAFVPGELLARSSRYFDLLAGCALDQEAVRALAAAAKDIGLPLFSAAFDEPSVDLLAALDVPAFKVASGDITHLPLLRHIGELGKPVILSTGGASIGEIEAALAALGAGPGSVPVALLHCVSHYPTRPEEANLACIATMKAQFGLPVGFSDHTLGAATAIAAVALGADVIEKHFTFDRAAEGPDHALSAEPEELARIALGMQAAWRAIGRPAKAPVESGEHIAQIRRSVTARTPITKGTRLTAAMLAVKRPGTGIAPGRLDDVIGRRARRDLDADQTLSWDLLD